MAVARACARVTSSVLRYLGQRVASQTTALGHHGNPTQPNTLPRRISHRLHWQCVHAPRIAYLCYDIYARNIRPAIDILRHEPGRMLMLPFRRRSSNNARVAITTGNEKAPVCRGRASYEDSNKLVGIMGFEPLRTAFGDFCHKSLCSEVCARD